VRVPVELRHAQEERIGAVQGGQAGSAIETEPDLVVLGVSRTYDKPTPQNSIVLFIDHQIGLMAGVRDFTSLAEYKSNIVGLARTARALQIPVLLSSSNAQWQNGDTLPELKELFADQPIYRRTGISNGYENPTFRKALEELANSTGQSMVPYRETASRESCSHSR